MSAAIAQLNREINSLTDRIHREQNEIERLEKQLTKLKEKKQRVLLSEAFDSPTNNEGK